MKLHLVVKELPLRVTGPVGRVLSKQSEIKQKRPVVARSDVSGKMTI